MSFLPFSLASVGTNRDQSVVFVGHKNNNSTLTHGSQLQKSREREVGIKAASMEGEQLKPSPVGETQRLTRALRRNSSTLSSKRPASESPGENGSTTKAAARGDNSNTSSPPDGDKLAATRQSSRIKHGAKKRKSEVSYILRLFVRVLLSSVSIAANKRQGPNTDNGGGDG